MTDDWMELRITLPEDEGGQLLKHLRKWYGLRQIDDDWTVHKRKRDNASVSYAPCPKPDDPKVKW